MDAPFKLIQATTLVYIFVHKTKGEKTLQCVGIRDQHGASCPAPGNLLWREYKGSAELQQTVLGRLEQQGE